jgi:hypothetical protein
MSFCHLNWQVAYFLLQAVIAFLSRSTLNAALIDGLSRTKLTSNQAKFYSVSADCETHHNNNHSINLPT